MIKTAVRGALVEACARLSCLWSARSLKEKKKNWKKKTLFCTALSIALMLAHFHSLLLYTYWWRHLRMCLKPPTPIKKFTISKPYHWHERATCALLFLFYKIIFLTQNILVRSLNWIWICKFDETNRGAWLKQGLRGRHFLHWFFRQQQMYL